MVIHLQLKETYSSGDGLKIDVSESIRRRERKHERMCKRKRALLSNMSKGRTVIPASFVVSGVYVPGVRFEPTCFRSFLLSLLLSFAMCRPHSFMKDLH